MLRLKQHSGEPWSLEGVKGAAGAAGGELPRESLLSGKTHVRLRVDQVHSTSDKNVALLT